MKIEGFTGKFQTASVASEGVRVAATSKTTGRISENDRHRPDASFKIKDSLRQINQTQPVVKARKTEVQHSDIKAREAIDEEKVVAALERYVQDHRPDPTVVMALKTHKPEISGENIVLAVDNQLQQDKLEALKVHLRNALAKLLNNGFIALSFKLFDDRNSKEEKKLFTAGEKFQHFVELNPVVANLKSVFGLELE